MCFQLQTWTCSDWDRCIFLSVNRIKTAAKMTDQHTLRSEKTGIFTTEFRLWNLLHQNLINLISTCWEMHSLACCWRVRWEVPQLFSCLMSGAFGLAWHKRLERGENRSKDSEVYEFCHREKDKLPFYEVAPLYLQESHESQWWSYTGILFLNAFTLCRIAVKWA